MKTINTYILSAFAALILLPFAASAQTGEVKQKKTVTDNGNGTYTVKLESYVTGQEVSNPLDIVLVLDNSNSMYSGGSYAVDGKQRNVLLKAAVSNFLDIIYNNGNTLNHRVSIIKFEGGGRRIDKYITYVNDAVVNGEIVNTSGLHASTICGGDDGWFELKTDGISSAKSAVNAMVKKEGDTGTPAADGLILARYLLSESDIASDGRQKLVVFFTDGCCGTGENWNAAQESSVSESEGYPSGTHIPNRYYAPYVIQQANYLKDIATIYCIGTFADFSIKEDGEIQKADTYFYMRHVSSEYDSEIRVDGNVPTTPTKGTKCSANQVPSTSTPASIYDYDQPYQSVDDGDKSTDLTNDEYVFDGSNTTKLNEAFSSIGNKIIEAAELGPSSAVAIDAMTNQFELPAGTTADDITLYTCNATVTGTASNPTINWADPVLYTPWLPSGSISDYISINPASSKSGIEFDSDYIEVTGFDYKTHFVGLNNTNGSQKLIIEFLIKAAPSNKGGLGVHTNDIHSGIYNKKDGADEYELVIAYDKPTVNLPYLKIVKKGLQKGESATFRVTKVTSATDDTPVADDPNTTDINEAYSANVMVSQADDSGVASATIKLVFNGYYKVEELTWSNLGYTVVKHDTNGNGNCTVTGNSYIRQMDTTAEGVARELIYTFENSNPEGTVRPAHAEDYVPNNMGVTESTPMTGGGTGETPASGAPGENPGGPVGF